MKRCPECRKDYADDSLMYCLDDGTALVQGRIADEPATVLLSGDRASGEGLTATLPAAVSKRSVNASAWIAAAVFAIVAAFFAYGYFDRPSKHDSRAVRVSFEPPAELAFNDTVPDAAVISPDGQRIVFSGMSSDGKNMLYVRELNSTETKLLPGSDNPLEPFWSPDSKSVAYGSNGKLKRSDLSAGNAQTLCDSARMVGGSWSKDGIIVFAPDYRKPVVQVSAKGGEPSPVVMDVPADSEERHRYPYFLPDGRRFLFSREVKGVWEGSLDSPEIRQILPDNTPVVYSKDGHLIFVRSDTLVAQAFDEKTLTLSGEPIPLITDQKSWINNFRFSASDDGTLVWQGVWERDYQLIWYDRTGKQVGTADAPSKVAAGEDPRISPDGKRIAIKRNPPNTIWVVDTEKGNSLRITNDFGQIPVWSPDGSRIAFSGVNGLMAKASNGLGDTETLLPGGAPFPRQWSPDGKYLIYLRRGVKTRLDMYAVSLQGDPKEMLLLNSPFDDDDPELSPDGKWLAYAADDTGSPEIYIQPFNDGTLGSDRKRISTSGGRMPVWDRRGTEIYWVAPDGNLMSSTIKPGGSGPEFGTPTALFKTRMIGTARLGYGSVHEFDVSPDGQRFLVGTVLGETKVPKPTMILNWPALTNK